MTEVKNAIWATALPDADGDAYHWQVGRPLWQNGKAGEAVTRITVQHDLPGLHCNMRRVCVWVGDELAVEAPLHNIQAVGYEVASQ